MELNLCIPRLAQRVLRAMDSRKPGFRYLLGKRALRHRLLCPSSPDRGGNEPKPTLRVLHRSDLSRLPHQVPPCTLISLPANVQSLPYHPILPGSRVEPRLPPPGGLLRRAGKPALESAAAAGRGGARRRGGLQVGRRRRPAPHLMQSPFRKPAGSPGSPRKRFLACSRLCVPARSPAS